MKTFHIKIIFGTNFQQNFQQTTFIQQNIKHYFVLYAKQFLASTMRKQICIF